MTMNRMALCVLSISMTLLLNGCQSGTDSGGAENGVKNYIGPHYPHHQKFAGYNVESEAEWDSVNQEAPKSVRDKSGAGSENNLRPDDVKIFGWHMYAHGSRYTNYNFDILWGVAYFGYMINPETGGYRSIHQWSETALVDSAHANGCKVFLTLGNFGAGDNSAFLNNPRAQSALADSVIALLALRKAQGVNIDFEGLPEGSGEKFSRFIELLSSRLRAANSGYLITLALYAIDRHKVFDITALDPHVDYYTLMAYDYYGGFSAQAGPVSPLKPSKLFGTGSMETSVDYYLKEGLPGSKLIVGLPLYGAHWRTADAAAPSKALEFIDHIPYNSFQTEYQLSIGGDRKENLATGDSYYPFLKDDAHEQVWIDDIPSLRGKLQFIKKKNLAGVGFWSLGYGFEREDVIEVVGEVLE